MSDGGRTGQPPNEALKAAQRRIDELGSRVARLEAEAAGQRQLVARLHESEATYHLLEDNVRDVIWTTDLDLRFTYLSRSELAMTGFTVEEALALGATDVLTPESLRRAGELLAEQLAREQDPSADPDRSVVVELEQLRKDGSVFPTETTITFLRDGAGQPVGLLGGTRDITERLRAAAERRRLETQVQHAQRLESLGLLASGIAHDFNNILTELLINANLALDDLPAESPLRPLLLDIKRAGHRASELTGQILAYSGGSMAVHRDTDVSALLQAMASQLTRATAAKVDVTCDLSPALPLVKADATQLRQVILNLVTNAVEAAAETGGHVQVLTYEHQPDGDDDRSDQVALGGEIGPDDFPFPLPKPREGERRGVEPLCGAVHPLCWIGAFHGRTGRRQRPRAAGTRSW